MESYFSYAFNLCITRVKNDYVNSQFLRFVFLLLVFISCEIVLAAPRPAAGYWLPAAVINISRQLTAGNRNENVPNALIINLIKRQKQEFNVL